MQTRNGRSKEPLSPLEQFTLVWNAGIRRQEAWITSRTNFQQLCEDVLCVQWWLFPDFKPSLGCKEFKFPLGEARSSKLGLIRSLKYFLFLRASLKLWQLRHNLSWSSAGRRASSGRPQRNVVKRPSSVGCGATPTLSSGAMLNTTGHASRIDFGEPELELSSQGANERKNPL